MNPYSVYKLIVERIRSDFRLAYGLRSIALSYFNACCTDPDNDIGELPYPGTHLISGAMMVLQRYVNFFAVFGADFDTLDCTAIRDYIPVTDLADAHVFAEELLLGGSPGSAYNLGTGRNYFVNEVLQAIELEAGERLSSGKGPGRAGDPDALVVHPAWGVSDVGVRLGVFGPSDRGSNRLSSAWNSWGASAVRSVGNRRSRARR